MNEKKPKIIMKTIPVDANRKVGNGNEGVVLLYDDIHQCYYETTLSHVINAAVARVEAIDRKLEQKYSDLEKRHLALEERLVAQQNQFIADMTSTNDAIIDMVQNGGSEK